ncbi:TetR family transcriptional regulator [Streptomyces sp. NPDC051561]|uniref:TetR family transcriptional regulator n=1 Tax=Streptomyces sp. NPDC051561 TaxID=3365658 RepID=UPI0037B89DB9
MTSEALTPERILEATEDVLRRHGAAKATVVDVARVLGVSHGSVYRHFRTKAALREAVTSRWLDRTTEALAVIATADQPAPEKVWTWLTALFEAKRKKAGDDPELFATYGVLLAENSGVVEAHIRELVGQLTRIVEEGARSRYFPAAGDPKVTAQAVFDATAKFHDPGYAAEWQKPGIVAEFRSVASLLQRGLLASE